MKETLIKWPQHIIYKKPTSCKTSKLAIPHEPVCMHVVFTTTSISPRIHNTLSSLKTTLPILFFFFLLEVEDAKIGRLHRPTCESRPAHLTPSLHLSSDVCALTPTLQNTERTIMYFSAGSITLNIMTPPSRATYFISCTNSL